MIEKFNPTSEDSAEETPKEVEVYHKLPQPVKLKVFAMMARGEKYKTIVSILEKKHGIEYSQNALAQLKKNNRATIAEMKAMIIEHEAQDSAQASTSAIRALNRKLDRAAEDEVELARLDEQYRAGELDLATYRRRKAGLLNMSVSDLVMIADKMNSIGTRGRGKAASIQPGGKENELPAGDDLGADPKMVEALTTAIQNGDTIALSQMVITPNANN